jgi:hypothetical protein
MKPRGSMKKNSEQIILNYSRALLQSRGRDSSKGCRFVMPTFYKNKVFANIEVHIDCIAICRAYKNPSKNNLE